MIRSTVMLSALLGLLALGCSGPEPGPGNEPASRPKPGPDTVAVWDGGQASLIDVEDVLRTLSDEERARREADIFTTYRETAREIALLRLLLPESRDPETRLQAWRAEYPGAYRKLVIQLYAGEMLGREPVEVTEDELRAFYDEHPQLFQQQARRQLRHIFRRALAENERGEAPEVVLAQVRARALAGVPFEELAATWSQSENRTRGGEVGWVEPGMLPPPLEKAVFALGRRELSEPVIGNEGGLLFYVEDAVEERHFPFEDVRLPLRRLLSQRRINERMVAAARAMEPPAGYQALSADEVAAASDDALVLRVSVPTVEDAALELRKSDLPAALLEDPRALATMLERQRLQALLWAGAEQAGFTARPEIRRRLSQSLDLSLRRAEIGKHLETATLERLDGREDELRAFFDRDPGRFTGPLRFHLRQLQVPLGDAASQLRLLEALHGQLAAGTLTLEQAAERASGHVLDLGWKRFDELEQLDSKERVYVLDLGGKGFTLPYRLGDDLWILQVVERRTPEPLSYEEARDQVREQYLRRHRDDLWREVADGILDRARYEYLDDRVRQALAVEPAP